MIFLTTIKMKKVKKYEIQRLKPIDGNEPELFLSKEQIEWLYFEVNQKEVKGIVTYLRERK